MIDGEILQNPKVKTLVTVLIFDLSDAKPSYIDGSFLDFYKVSLYSLNDKLQKTGELSVDHNNGHQIYGNSSSSQSDC